jgi:hypothetical protein
VLFFFELGVFLFLCSCLIEPTESGGVFGGFVSGVGFESGAFCGTKWMNSATVFGFGLRQGEILSRF